MLCVAFLLASLSCCAQAQHVVFPVDSTFLYAVGVTGARPLFFRSSRQLDDLNEATSTEDEEQATPLDAALAVVSAASASPLRRKQCPRGYELRFDRPARKYECRCKKYHLYWPGDGLCYREYHRGPCPEGHR